MAKTITRRTFIANSSKMAAIAGIGGAEFLLKGCTTKQNYDLIIKNGRILNGLGDSDFVADIGIIEGTIEKIGKIPVSRGKTVLDATHRIVCPGFIDAHDHSDIGLLVNPKAESHIRQGITTLVSGNCGASPFPIAEEIYEEYRANLKEQYDIELSWREIKGFFSTIEEKGIALNYATFVGQGTIRGASMGFYDRQPKPEELGTMRQMVKESVRNGALGLSSGLEYAPGSYAQPEEIIELCRVCADNGGLYSTHMRDEGDRLLEALDETIDIARKTGLSVQISHFKSAYPRNWYKMDEALAKVEEASQQGLSLFCDRYPYIAGATGLSSFNFPLWAKQGTTEKFLSRLKDPTLEDKLRAHVKEREEKVGSWDKVVVSSVFSKKNRRFEGMSVLEGSKRTGKDAFEFMRDLLIEEKDKVGMVIFMMTEENLQKALSHPLVGIGCDGAAMAPYGKLKIGKPHPRSYGTFPRVLGKYIREEKILPLAEMIKKMTSLPAKKFGFLRRGVLQEGYMADIVIFDEDRVKDKATWKDPHQYPEGIEHVVVNGQIVIQNEEHTGNLPGIILRRNHKA